MKTLLTILAFNLLTILPAFSQTGTNIGRFYTLTGNTVLFKCDIFANTAPYDNKWEELPGGSKFTIVRKIEYTDTNSSAAAKELKTYYVVRFWEWDTTQVNGDEKQKSLLKNENFVKTAGGIQVYFRLSSDELADYAEEVIKKFEPIAGTITVPFKFRTQGGFNFSKDISITGLGGMKYNFGNSGKTSLALVFGVGLSSVTLDSLNTGGMVADAEERAAATLSTGLLFQWERLQVGLMMGSDLLPASSRDNWIYHGKPWLAVGIGFSIFNGDSKEVKEESDNSSSTKED